MKNNVTWPSNTLTASESEKKNVDKGRQTEKVKEKVPHTRQAETARAP